MRDATDHVTTIACSLDRAQLADRRCVWEALARVALKEPISQKLNSLV